MSQMVEIWRRIIRGDDKSWVLFENGTCVILMQPDSDLAAQAIALMRDWGPMGIGCSAGDFSVITLDNEQGWVVTSHHDDILTYVGSEEVPPDAEEVVVGLAGRSKRDSDAQSLAIIHVEDRRASGAAGLS